MIYENTCESHGHIKDDDGEELYLTTCVSCLSSMMANRRKEREYVEKQAAKSGGKLDV